MAKRKSKYNYLQIAGGTLAGFGGAKLLDYGIVSLWELAINKPGITKVAKNTGLSEDLVFEWLDYQINAGMVYRGELDADEFNKNILPNYTITVPQLNKITTEYKKLGWLDKPNYFRTISASSGIIAGGIGLALMQNKKYKNFGMGLIAGGLVKVIMSFLSSDPYKDFRSVYRGIGKRSGVLYSLASKQPK